MGKRLGDPDDPLLVSVRSGAKFSMPGMMETVLNVGLNDASVVGLAASAGGNERFAWDSYRRLIQMFGKTVCDVPGEEFEHALDEAKTRQGHHRRPATWTPTTCAGSSTRTRRSSASTPGGTSRRTRASSSTSPSARSSTRGTPSAPCSTAARSASRPTSAPRSTWCTMVFGNLGADSGTGVAFTRDPATGAQGVYGDYLANAQGEDVVAGIRNTVPLQELEQLDKSVLRRAAGDHGAARGALPRPLRHRVHHRARQALDAADPGRQAHRRPPPSSSPASSSTRA